ncbi:uncharacterized protein LOC135491344 isoform X2 [Lineus longissimus]|uniref:uncharacterized protein LOC135491344 isoform X2 n=1 Tax=Lineus longissimus TaxID=88925 RepID=UPI00315CF36C
MKESRRVKVRPFASLRKVEKLFLLVSAINILATIGLTIERLVVIIAVEKNPDTPDLTFAILLLINSAFCTFYVIHGVLRERRFEILAYVAAILVVLGYCVIEYIVNAEGRNKVKLVRLIFACILAPLNVYLAFLVAKEFGFLSFRIVGASELLQHLYKQAAAFSCLLKFDLEVSISFIVLALQQGTRITSAEIITLLVGLPYSLVYSVLGTVAMFKEWKVAMWIFGFLSLPGVGFIIFKFYELYSSLDTEVVGSAAVVTYAPLIAGSIYLIVHVVLILEAVLVYRGFGKGLREAAYTAPPNERTNLLFGVRVKRNPPRQS